MSHRSATLVGYTPSVRLLAPLLAATPKNLVRNYHEGCAWGIHVKYYDGKSTNSKNVHYRGEPHTAPPSEYELH